MVKLTNFTPSRTSPRPGSLHPSTRLDRAVPTAEQSDGASTNTMAGPRGRLPVWLSAVILLAAPPRGPKRFRGELHARPLGASRDRRQGRSADRCCRRAK